MHTDGLGSGDTFGDDPVLDALWTECEDGNNRSCDVLYRDSPFGSDYEAFGESCAGREREQPSSCLTTDEAASFGYGDDAELDVLYEACRDGDGAACDELFFDSPFGSEYEDFGNTCGGRDGQDEDGFCG